MSLPDKCPFCGAEVSCGVTGSWVGFSCLTSIHVNQEVRRTQSRKCEVSERDRMLASVAELEARCKRLEEAAREVYLDSIASDHPWTELETRNMHALRDVLEAKP